jgi:hypothetical protein
MPKRTLDGFKPFWCDYYDNTKRAIARERGNVALKTIKQSDITPRIRELWNNLSEKEKEEYLERDNR